MSSDARLDPLDRPLELARRPSRRGSPRRRSAAWSRSRRRPRARSTRMRSSLIPSRSARNRRTKCGTWVRACSVSAPRAVVGEHAARLDRRAGRAVVDDAPLDDRRRPRRSRPRGRRRRATTRGHLLVPRSLVDERRRPRSAASGSTTTGSGSYSTTTSLGGVDDARSGRRRSRRATGSPTCLTSPLASGQCSGVVDLDARRDPGHRQRRLRGRRSSPVKTRDDAVAGLAPPRRRSRRSSACASGERTNAAHSCPASDDVVDVARRGP